MFHFDRGLKLTAIDLAIDVCRRQPRGFISHAHADHMAHHELAFCTPTTARFYQHRLGRRRVIEMPFGETIDRDGIALTTFPAGHILGSAMLLANDGARRLLYTGDFKLGESATAEQAEFPGTDVLIMECTFGNAKYRLPPRQQVIDELCGRIRDEFATGRTPVIHAYTLGKAQEITKILSDNGFRVQQHPKIHTISQTYEQCGCVLGNYSLYDGKLLDGHVLVLPPKSQRGQTIGVSCTTSFMLTGWAMDYNAKYRYGVDHVLPLSDHADYDELFEAVALCGAEVIYCTHGPESFSQQLRDAGFNAFTLGRDTQLTLF